MSENPDIPTPPMTAISDADLDELRGLIADDVRPYEHTLWFRVLARLDAAEAALATTRKEADDDNDEWSVIVDDLHQAARAAEAHLADVEAESAAKDAVIEAAREWEAMMRNLATLSAPGGIDVSDQLGANMERLVAALAALAVDP